jgi:hypothetical protein
MGGHCYAPAWPALRADQLLPVSAPIPTPPRDDRIDCGPRVPLRYPTAFMDPRSTLEFRTLRLASHFGTLIVFYSLRRRERAWSFINGIKLGNLIPGGRPELFEPSRGD